MSNIAIKVENLSKRYRIGLKEELHDTFIGAFTSWVRYPISNFKRVQKLSKFNKDGDSEDIIWALKNVSFEVNHGEVLGIIGRNGAGKSTLLKILSRITEPTKGYASVNGRVTSLLEVGTGFHPELTGRENVFLNAAILGMSKEEIARKFDMIVDFSGVEKFIDTPVKRYSSGMSVRLAFAIAAHLEPDILIIDEVLAVGDVQFQKKCLGKMGDITKEGRTVLFVSHNMAAIESFCKRVLLLDKGVVLSDDNAQTVIDKYLRIGVEQSGEKVWPDMHSAPGDEKARLRSVRVLDRNGEVSTFFDVRDSVFLEMEYWVLRDVDWLDVSFYCFNSRGNLIFSTLDDTTDDPSEGRKRKAGFYLSRCHIPPDFLNNGQVYVQAALTDERKVHTIQRDIVMFNVGDAMDPEGARGNYRDAWETTAVVRPKFKWNMERFPLTQRMEN